MSDLYPTSLDLEMAEEDLQDLLDMPSVKELLDYQKKVAANSSKFGGAANLASLPDYTYADPYDIGDMQKLLQCETAEYNPNTNTIERIVADPNDVSHLFEAMSRTDRASTLGTLRKFQETGVTSTSKVSEFFANEAMNAIYDDHLLKSHIVSNPTRGARLDLTGQNFNEQESWSLIFSAANPEFHSTFHKNFLIQMNHRITQEAVEKNRNFFPSGEQRNPDHMRDSFTWDKFQKMALQCAKDAFERTRLIMTMNKTRDDVQQAVKSFSKEYDKRIAPKIANEDMVEVFGKTFHVRKNETLAKAVTRIKPEYKAFAAKRLDEYRDNKGMEMILAQGIAKAHGSKNVTPEHLKEASQALKNAKKNPVEFRSVERVIRQVTGNDRATTNALLHNTDGRSSFQRNRKTLERMGARLHAQSEGRTRVLKADMVHGQAFAATALMDVPPRAMATARNAALRENNYSIKDAAETQKAMKTSIGRLKDERGKDTSRDELLKRAEPVQEVKQDKPVEPKHGPDDDDGGYTPDGSGGRRRRR